MARQYAIIGLGSFGSQVLEKLAEASDQIIIVDKSRETVERFKEYAAKSYITDALSADALMRIVPEGIDVAVVDVGAHLEAAIVVTNALKKLKAKQIIVRADDEERGEILAMVGATRVIYPAKEAAAKLVPMLVSSTLFSFMPISASLVLAELLVPAHYVGKTLIEANLRQSRGINVVAMRTDGEDDYRFTDPVHRLEKDDVLLCAGTEDDVAAFTGARILSRKNVVTDLLRGVFGKKKKPVQPIGIEEKDKE